MQPLVGKGIKDSLLEGVLTIDSGNQRVGINNTAPTTALDVSGTTTTTTLVVSGTTTTSRMVLTPITTAQRDALTASEGMVIFNTTTKKLNVYNGTIWEAVTSA